MNYITIGLCTDYSDWISTIIRWLTWSSYSHVVLVSPDGQTIAEATHGKPVRLDSLVNFLARDRATIRRIPHPNPELAWQIARQWAIDRRAYDSSFSWGWLFRRKLQDPQKLSCVELLLESSQLAGKRLVAGIYDRITPDDLFMISEEIDTCPT